ncbi:bifunctional prephenate dehydrogenase/3-phosphoshikimate 1-carboxyvinyltransferase [Neptunomonas japonica]|uniref:bifunctional prephenate dehydrogenase/3-phosphoshikimate 1-carboxyvinyltransferase n=1 Tax=Neptunomonas japonica TaxID=417574 RepID=UPI00055C219C|nr:bifunctional prephenate dehydrogenase/3-phosphoshikimate 1-carboxyvinyltransferase [Neptunomonas japonica]
MANRVLIIGLGLIGGSLAKALKKKHFANVVVGCDRNLDELQQGIDLGIIDEGCNDFASAVKAADIIVLAVPVKATEAVLFDLKPYLQPHTVITDVGSTKGNVIVAAQNVFGSVPRNFIPGHPIAGSEKSGVAAADDTLFVKHKVILTPLPESDKRATHLIARMWQSTGAEVLQMAIERHDEVLAATSHLPHLLAFSLVDTLAKEQDSTEIFRYAAGGFRDFTRIAASDPTMWHDVCLANKQQILDQIDNFTEGLASLRRAIVEGDSQSMLGVFTRAKSAREHFNKMLTGTAYSQTHHNLQVTFHIRSAGPLLGRISVSGDKSMSHRAVVLGALAEGVTNINGFLESEDSLATVQAFRSMGVVIEGPHQGAVKIYGVGLHGLYPPPGPLYLGNSGTSMRLLSGLLAAQQFDTELLGDKSLSKRPMERVAEPLREMGASINTSENGGAPVYISGGQQLSGINYQMPVASAQVKSALLLAGLYAQGVTQIKQPAITRDHTERMLKNFGVELTTQNSVVSIASGQILKATNLDIPADISSAAFFIVAAAINPGSDLVIEQVGVNPSRSGILEIMKMMGADLSLENPMTLNGEPVADVHVRYAPLKAITIPEELVSVAIDEFPVIFVAAAAATGVTCLTGVGELRYKESDRIEAMQQGLLRMGINVVVESDNILITGGKLQGANISSYDDHRVTMAFAVAGTIAKDEVTIEACSHVATSFPEFIEIAQKAGIRIHKEETNVSS